MSLLHASNVLRYGAREQPGKRRNHSGIVGVVRGRRERVVWEQDGRPYFPSEPAEDEALVGDVDESLLDHYAE